MARTPQYATATDFAQFYSRQMRDIGSNTPGLDTTQVNLYLTRAEDQIDDLGSRTWLQSKTMVAPDGTGLLLPVIFTRRNSFGRGYTASFKVPIGPIQSITKLEFYIGGAGYSDQTANINNENRPNGIWFDPNSNEVFIGGNITPPVVIKDAIRIQYVAGIGTGAHVTIPGEVTEATVLLAAYLYAQSEAWFFNVPKAQGIPDRTALAEGWKRRAYELLNIQRPMVWS